MIDDDAAITMALTVRLSALGYEVISSQNGISGLEAAQEKRPDVILLDIRLPDVDGFDVNRRLKAMPGLAGVPVVVLSAHAQETTRQKALAAGVKYFLAKPYEAAQLVAAIEAVTAS